MEILGLVNSIISTIGIFNILILLAAVVGAVWSIVGAVVFLIKKSDVEKIGPVTFDTDDDKPAPKKRKILNRKA